MGHKAKVHTTFNKQANSWRNVSEGASRPAKTYQTKQAAQQAGRETAIKRRVEHIIHNKDGIIGSRNSYGNDPRNRQG